MHLRMVTLAQIREELRTHEQFCRQMKAQTMKSCFYQRSFVSQIQQDFDDSESAEVAAIQRKQLKCWNCDMLSHRFNECFEARTIDLLVLSDDFESHIKLLEEIAGYLRDANLTINIAKSKFCMTEIKYLGFVIGHGELKVDRDNKSAIEKFPAPTTVKQLRRFLDCRSPN